MENMEMKENFLEIARANFQKWNEALQTKDARQVAELYSEDNLFLPTVLGEFKKGVDGAEQYFKHFLEKDPIGKIVEDDVKKLSDDSFVHVGHYNFELGPKDKREITEARFTFVYKKDKDGKWKIVHHHSSVMPAAH